MNQAVAAFNKDKKKGSKDDVNTGPTESEKFKQAMVLAKEAIEQAKAAKKDIVTSEDGKNVLKDTQNEAINKAEELLALATTTSNLEKITSTIKKETAEYNVVKQAGTKDVDSPDLNREEAFKKIDQAQKALEKAVVSSDGKDVNVTEYWVTNSEKEALQEAIRKASQGVADAITEEDINQVIKELDDALATHQAAMKLGSKEGNDNVLEQPKTAGQDKVTAYEKEIADVPVLEDGNNVDPKDKWVSDSAKAAMEKALVDAKR